METESFVIILFLLASVVAVYARHLRMPYTVALVLVGLGLGAAHWFQAPQLTQNMLFLIFLPGLVFEAAFHIDFDELWRDKAAVLGLAVPGVAASIGITAVLVVFASTAIHHLPDIGWLLALAFGAAVAATDPISVVALFKELGAPRRLTLLIEGESLLNDGTAIVLFTMVLTLIMGKVLSPAGMVVEFGAVVGGGLFIGGIVGLLISQIIKRVDDAMVDITLTTVAAYGSFLLAYKLGYSGVISTATAGLICGNYGARTGMSAASRVAAETFWGYVGFALNSLVFLLLGLEIQLDTLLNIWLMIIVAYLAITVARLLVVFGAYGLLAISAKRIPRSWAVVLTWGGLRGALSMVLVLSLPADLPLRDLIINMVFGVVLLTILLQGLSMTPLARQLGILGRREAIKAYEIVRTRLQLAQDVLEQIGQMRKNSHIDSRALDRMEAVYSARIEALNAEFSRSSFDSATRYSEELTQLQRRMLLFEKKQALEARRYGVIGASAFDELSAEIDARILALESTSGQCADPAQEEPRV